MTAPVEHYRSIFFEETAEHLADVEAGLLGMESDPHDAALIDQVFRGVHSIKGGASTFGMETVAEFSHSLESHLDRIRSGERECDSDSLETMLRSIGPACGHWSSRPSPTNRWTRRYRGALPR